MTDIHCIHAQTCKELCADAALISYVNCPYTLRTLKLSTLNESNIELSQDLNIDDDMGSRDEIIARLRQLPDVLGRADSEIAETLGISASLWSNYKAEHTDVTIRPMVALELWNAFGIPMEWIYDGQSARTPDPQMRAKLATANRRAEAWLASRRPSGNLRFRNMLAVALACAVIVGACTGAGQAWERTDGLPIALQKYDADRMYCRAEAKRIVHVASAAEEIEGAPDMMDIYLGCMTGRGYFPKGKWYKE